MYIWQYFIVFVFSNVYDIYELNKFSVEETTEDCFNQANDKWSSVCETQGTNGYTYYLAFSI